MDYGLSFVYIMLYLILWIISSNYQLKYKNIYINNEYIDEWFMINKTIHKCGKYKCFYSNNKNYQYNAILYSRLYYNKNTDKNNKSLYLLCNIEALSRWEYMKRIIDGSDKMYDVLISYKFLITKHHFSYTYYYNNIDLIINDAKNSIISLNKFMKRKDIVFIYGMNYKHR